MACGSLDVCFPTLSNAILAGLNWFAARKDMSQTYGGTHGDITDPLAPSTARQQGLCECGCAEAKTAPGHAASRLHHATYRFQRSFLLGW